MTANWAYRIADDGRHGISNQEWFSDVDYNLPEHNDAASRSSRLFLRHVDLVIVAAIREDVREAMGFELAPKAFSGVCDTILDELEDVEWREAELQVGSEVLPAEVTTYRGIDFIFPIRWPPPESDFVLHRASTGDATRGWPAVIRRNAG